MTLKLAVCLKVVPKPEEVTLDEESMTIDREDATSELNPADKNALEMALSMKDAHPDAEVYVFSMGPPLFVPFLRDVMSMGVDDAILLSDRAFGGADTYPTSRVLAAGVRKVGDVDLVLCGEESSDSSTGQVPPGIAEWLDATQVTYVADATVDPDAGTLTATRTVTGGEETVRVPLPTVVSVEYGINDPRFLDYREKQRLDDEEWEPTVWDHEDLEIPAEELGLDGSFTEVASLESVEAPERKQEWIEGDPDEQAEELAAIVQEELG